MKKLIIVALCLLSANILTAGNTQSGVPDAQAEEPALSDYELLDELYHALNTNDPEEITEVLSTMEAQQKLNLLNDYFIRYIDNTKGEWHMRSALLYATYRGFTDIVDLLLQYGANANGGPLEIDNPSTLRDYVVLTPLQVAGLQGQSLAVQHLLQAGANPNYRIQYEGTALNTALFCAIKGHCSADTIAMLLEKGAQRCPYLSKDGEGSALHCAAKNKNEDAIRALLSSFSTESDKKRYVEMVNNNGETALHLAAVTGHCPSISALLDNGAPIHATNCHGNTPLKVAREQNHIDAVKLLFACGASY